MHHATHATALCSTHNIHITHMHVVHIAHAHITHANHTHPTQITHHAHTNHTSRTHTPHTPQITHIQDAILAHLYTSQLVTHPREVRHSLPLYGSLLWPPPAYGPLLPTAPSCLWLPPAYGSLFCWVHHVPKWSQFEGLASFIREKTKNQYVAVMVAEQKYR